MHSASFQRCKGKQIITPISRLSLLQETCAASSHQYAVCRVLLCPYLSLKIYFTVFSQKNYPSFLGDPTQDLPTPTCDMLASHQFTVNLNLRFHITLQLAHSAWFLLICLIGCQVHTFHASTLSLLSCRFQNARAALQVHNVAAAIAHSQVTIPLITLNHELLFSIDK